MADRNQKWLEEIRRKVGEKIRRMRLLRDIERKRFAKEIKVSEGTVSNIENGKYSVPAERLWLIAVVLGCSPSDLLPPMPETSKDFEAKLKEVEDKEMKKWLQNIFPKPPTQ